MLLTLSLPSNSHFEQNPENADIIIFCTVMLLLQGLLTLHYFKHRFCGCKRDFWPVLRDSFFVVLALYLLLIFLLYFR